MNYTPLKWMDDHFGLICPVNDFAYVMDDFGNAIEVPFSMPHFWWQDV